MKSIGLGFLLIIAFLIISLGLTWIVTGNDFFLYKYFATKTEAVRRQVFEQSKAYNQSMHQELSQLRRDFLIAKDDEGRAGIASLAIHDFSDYPDSCLTLDEREFINKMKQIKFGKNY
jgi:hypothetical protein